MMFQIGIVGLPNVGKSTFFNVLTKSQANADNFPFCTIDPNESKFHSFGTKVSLKQLKLFNIYCLKHNCCWNSVLGRVPVPDDRWEFLCEFYKPDRFVFMRYFHTVPICISFGLAKSQLF